MLAHGFMLKMADSIEAVSSVCERERDIHREREKHAKRETLFLWLVCNLLCRPR